MSGRWAGTATRGWRERGSGTALSLGLIGVTLVLLAAGLVLVAAMGAGQRARTAADLAALAAAAHALRGDSPAQACGVASGVARANGAELRACRVAGGFVDVRVTASAGVRGLESAEHRARAGPR